MDIAIFIFYLLLTCLCISVMPFYKKSGIKKQLLIPLFLIKIIAGVTYAKFYSLPKYYTGSDTWRFFRLSIEEKKWLMSDPIAFIKDLFVYGYNKPGNIFAGENSYWNDLKSNIPVKLLAIMNVLTNDNYYANIILFNFLFFIGLVALYNVFIKYAPQKKWEIVIGVFLLPSTLFWCSGIHKDGLILSAIGCIIYLLDKKNHSILNTITIALVALLIFSLRNYLLIALIPAIFCWLISKKYKDYTLKIYLAIYSLGIVLFFTIPLVINSFNPLIILAEKQKEFLQLSGGSSVISEPLIPTIKGYIAYFPSAFDIAFFRPHINEISNTAYIPAIAENLLLYLMVVVCFFTSRKKIKGLAFFLCLIFFSLSILLICGYTITLTGAIVRYRSIALPFVITSLLCISKWPFPLFGLNSKEDYYADNP